jgi:hypothetical protein
MCHSFPARLTGTSLLIGLSSVLSLAACTGTIGGGSPIGLGGGGNTGGGLGGNGIAGNGGVGQNGGASGSSGGGSGGGVTGAGGVIAALPAPSACVDGNPGPRMLRRLTADQFTASIQDLFQDKSVAVAQVFNDPTVLGFTSDATGLVVQDLNADQLMTNAESVAAWAVGAHLSQITGGCSSTDAKCPESFIRSFGKRAFRAPVSESDVTAYKQIFAAETAFNDGVTAVVSAMLQAPGFLYRSEIGAIPLTGTDATIALTPYEVASSLSYLLTGSMPDAALLSAADDVANAKAGATIAAMVTAQMQRLLASSVSQEAVMGFMNGWLGLNRLYTQVKDDSIYMLTDAMRADMQGETQSLILDTFANNGGMSDLLTANYSFLTKNLADYYGIDSTGLGTSFTKVPYDTSTPRDGGILAQATILAGYARASNSSPTQRGHLVRTRLLCQNIPDPPPGLDVTFHPAVNAQTTRDHYLLEHSLLNNDPSQTVCTGCHQEMDWIGFTSEHYDEFGRRRETENGIAIDATGKILNANPTDGDVQLDGLTGTAGLETYLATNNDLKQCMIRYWSYYAYGSASWPQDACTYSAIQQAAVSSSYSLSSVLQAIIQSPHFTTRARQ